MSSGDLLSGIDPREASQDQRQLWQSAYAGTNFLDTKSYLVLLALRDDPTKKIYATLEIGRLGVKIDIPLEEHTPQVELLNEAYLHSTFFGEIDPERYREHATETFTAEKLLAFLNKTSTGADTPNDAPSRFYDMLNLSHGRDYGLIHISSHGGSTRRGYDFNATIEPMLREFHADLTDASEEKQINNAQGFTHLVQVSLPHMTITPLPVETYLQDVQNALRFLPRDWTV